MKSTTAGTAGAAHLADLQLVVHHKWSVLDNGLANGLAADEQELEPRLRGRGLHLRGRTAQTANEAMQQGPSRLAHRTRFSKRGICQPYCSSPCNNGCTQSGSSSEVARQAVHSSPCRPRCAARMRARFARPCRRCGPRPRRHTACGEQQAHRLLATGVDRQSAGQRSVGEKGCTWRNPTPTQAARSIAARVKCSNSTTASSPQIRSTPLARPAARWRQAPGARPAAAPGCAA